MIDTHKKTLIHHSVGNIASPITKLVYTKRFMFSIETGCFSTQNNTMVLINTSITKKLRYRFTVRFRRSFSLPCSYAK